MMFHKKYIGYTKVSHRLFKIIINNIINMYAKIKKMKFPNKYNWKAKYIMLS